MSLQFPLIKCRRYAEKYRFQEELGRDSKCGRLPPKWSLDVRLKKPILDLNSSWIKEHLSIINDGNNLNKFIFGHSVLKNAMSKNYKMQNVTITLTNAMLHATSVELF